MNHWSFDWLLKTPLLYASEIILFTIIRCMNSRKIRSPTLLHVRGEGREEQKATLSHTPVRNEPLLQKRGTVSLELREFLRQVYKTSGKVCGTRDPVTLTEEPYLKHQTPLPFSCPSNETLICSTEIQLRKIHVNCVSRRVSYSVSLKVRSDRS